MFSHSCPYCLFSLLLTPKVRISYISFQKYFMCLSVLAACIYVHHTSAWCPWTSEARLRSPGTGVMKPGSSARVTGLLNAEPSTQPEFPLLVTKIACHTSAFLFYYFVKCREHGSISDSTELPHSSLGNPVRMNHSYLITSLILCSRILFLLMFCYYK